MALPYFPFYPNDWVGSLRVDQLTATEERGYFRLLCSAWALPDCTLPADEKSLLRWSKIEDPKELRNVLKQFFDKTKDGWRNEKLYEKWKKSNEKHKSASESAKIRWGRK